MAALSRKLAACARPAHGGHARHDRARHSHQERPCRQAFPTQVMLVRGWLAIEDAVLAAHRTGLAT